MRYRAPSAASAIFSPQKLVCVIFAVVLMLLPGVGAGTPAPAAQATDDLRLELPANGNIRVENLCGSVIAEVWSESYVSVSAIADNGEARSLPAVVDRKEALLSIRLPRGTGPSRVNLELRVPARAHLAIVTGDGPVEVRGLAAALLVQSVTGEIRVELPANAKANVTADSRTGSVTSSIASLEAKRSASPQITGRIGGGGSSVRIFSQAGNVTLATAAQESARVVTTSPEQTVPLPVRAPVRRPSLRPSPRRSLRVTSSALIRNSSAST